MVYELNIDTECPVLVLELLAEYKEIAEGVFFFWEPWASITLRHPDMDAISKIHLMLLAHEFEPAMQIEQDDEKAYGVHWPNVLAYFQSVAQITLGLIRHKERPKILTLPKLHHCATNMLGVNDQEELDYIEGWIEVKKQIMDDDAKGLVGKGYAPAVKPYVRRGQFLI